jgi:hypothetical protein
MIIVASNREPDLWNYHTPAILLRSKQKHDRLQLIGKNMNVAECWKPRASSQPHGATSAEDINNGAKQTVDERPFSSP